MKKILFLTVLFAVSFYSCAIREYYSSVRSLEENRYFYGQMIYNGKTAGWFNVPAKLLKVSDHAAFYIQTKFHANYTRDASNPTTISLYDLEKLAQEFDYYYRYMINIYGEHTDIDGNSKIIILLMDINWSLTNGQNASSSKVLGYFNPNDMHGFNEGEILYMDLKSIKQELYNAIGTMIHEFQHLINYSYVVNGKRRAMSTWLNEALSESTSILFNKETATNRMSSFNDISYYSFYTWDIPSNVRNNQLVNYPSASVFMHWLYNTNNKNSDIFKKIAKSTDGADWQKVFNAAKSINGLTGLTGWDDLLLTWMSNAINGITNCWDSSVVTKVKQTNGTTSLYPGAMVVYSNYSNSSNSNIVTRTNNTTNIIVLNKDTTVTSNPATTSVSGSSSQNTRSVRARRSVTDTQTDEIPTINILLDRDGNIQKY